MSSNSAPSRFSFVFELNEAYSEYVTNALREFNQTRKSPIWLNFSQASAPLEVFALDDNGSVIGGLIGKTNGVPEWLEVSIIWVSEEKRGQGIGYHLMSLAEQEAKRRSCRYARLATSDYQAPHFYVKVGYRLYGQLENCPRGETVYYFYKELV